MIKKLIGVALATSVALGGGVAVASSAHAATPKHYSNCKALNAKYKGGVAKSGKAKNTKTVNGRKVSAKSTYKPRVNKALYKANARLDRDKDGIACER